MTIAHERPRFIPVLILILAVLAILRAGNVWLGFNSATAETSLHDNMAPEEQMVSEKMAMAPPPTTSVKSEVERRLFNQLADRRKLLDARAEELDTREKLLEEVEASIDRKLSHLTQQQASLSVLLTERSDCLLYTSPSPRDS